jgi:hypothetical protein
MNPVILRIKQLIFKYECIKRDLLDEEKYLQAKAVNEMLVDLKKLHELTEK